MIYKGSVSACAELQIEGGDKPTVASKDTPAMSFVGSGL